MKPLLQNISSEMAKLLETRGSKRTFCENAQIFAGGDEALFLPIILSGRVKMFHFLEVGKEVIIGIFEKGEMFAVPPVFDGKSYPATASAIETTELLMIKRPDFLELLRDSHEFSFAVIEWMSEMLREKTATIQNLATASPEHRVGHVLLKLAEKEPVNVGVRITLKRREIAEMAGLTTETTIRVIRRFAENDLVRIVHGKIILDSLEPLRAQISS